MLKQVQDDLKMFLGLYLVKNSEFISEGLLRKFSINYTEEA